MDVRRVTFSSQENQGESGGENLQNVKKQKSLALFLQKERKREETTVGALPDNTMHHGDE